MTTAKYICSYLCQIFLVLWLGIFHFLVLKKQPTPKQWHFGVSRIKIERILGEYGGLKLVNMPEYTMQTTVSSQHQSKSVPTSGCFAHLLRTRGEFMAIRDGGIIGTRTLMTQWAIPCKKDALKTRFQDV